MKTSTPLKIAVLAPIPMASESTAMAMRAPPRRSERIAYLMSCQISSMASQLWWGDSARYRRHYESPGAGFRRPKFAT
jgi:hypothetical protein